MTFNVAMYAALGDLLTEKDLKYLFPHAYDHGRAVFSSVRTDILPLHCSAVLLLMDPGWGCQGHCTGELVHCYLLHLRVLHVYGKVYTGVDRSRGCCIEFSCAWRHADVLTQGLLAPTDL